MANPLARRRAGVPDDQVPGARARAFSNRRKLEAGRSLGSPRSDEPRDEWRRSKTGIRQARNRPKFGCMKLLVAMRPLAPLHRGLRVVGFWVPHCRWTWVPLVASVARGRPG